MSDVFCFAKTERMQILDSLSCRFVPQSLGLFEEWGRTKPGAIQLTRIPRGASPSDRDRAIPFRAALLIE